MKLTSVILLMIVLISSGCTGISPKPTDVSGFAKLDVSVKQLNQDMASMNATVAKINDMQALVTSLRTDYTANAKILSDKVATLDGKVSKGQDMTTYQNQITALESGMKAVNTNAGLQSKTLSDIQILQKRIQAEFGSMQLVQNDLSRQMADLTNAYNQYNQNVNRITALEDRLHLVDGK
jgi:chromosome segregation ATPase